MESDVAVCMRILDQVLHQRNANWSEALSGLVTSGFDEASLDWEVGYPRAIVNTSAEGPSIHLDFKAGDEEYLFRAVFERGVDGWRLRVFQGACAACFGSGVLGDERCYICDGSGFHP